MFLTNNRTTSITTSHASNELAGDGGGGGDGGDGGDRDGGGVAMVMVMVGTALYSTHARANHACRGYNLRTTQYIVPSTGTGAVDGVAYERVGQRAFASVDIAAGAEVLNCYLVDPSSMSKGERREALQQYLFKCDCSLCEEEEEEESDEDGDGGSDTDY